MIVFCYMRGIQFLGFYQSVGVLTIVINDMMNDIAVWTVRSPARPGLDLGTSRWSP